MKDHSFHLSWKTASITAAVAIATSVGVYYYLHSRKKLKSAQSLDIDDSDVTVLPEPRQEAIKIKEKGNTYYKGGRYEIAIECYTNALELCPPEYKQDKAILYQNRAVALENLKKLEEALLDLNEALVLHPRYEKALIRRSKIHEELGNHRDALIDITAALIFNNFKIAELMNRMELIVKNIAKVEVEKELNGIPILQSDSYIRTYFESFPSDPFLNDEDHVEQSGDSDQQSMTECINLMRQGKYQDCFKLVQDLLKSELPEEILSRLYLLRGTFYVLSCREDLALDDFALILKNSYARPSVTINALIKRAMIMINNENIVEAEKAFTEALQIDPDCPDIYYHRGSLFEGMERVQDAINDYKRALQQNPKYSFAAVHKIFNESRINASMNAYDNFKLLIKQFPRCVECNIIFAQVLLNEERSAEAEKVCENLLLNQPKSGTIMATLAMIKISQNKLSEARELLNETIKDDPKCSYSYNTLATIYIKEGDLQKALELLNVAIKYAKNRQEMQNFIATREGVRAQLIVSVNYNIPPKEIFAAILQGLDMSPSSSYM